jgi:hypothetical protein
MLKKIREMAKNFQESAPAEIDYIDIVIRVSTVNEKLGGVAIYSVFTLNPYTKEEETVRRVEYSAPVGDKFDLQLFLDECYKFSEDH